MNSKLAKQQSVPTLLSCRQDNKTSATLPQYPLLKLQQSVGNQAVKKLFQGRVIQAKLKLGAPNDKYEIEADRVADLVMRMPMSTGFDDSCSRCGNKHENQTSHKIQAKENQGVSPIMTPAIPSGIRSLPGNGQPLADSSRAFFEPRFGQDLSHIRIHTNNKGANLARTLNAKAFTLGRDIVFGSGQYQPNNNVGRHLMAHELAHTVQQQDRSSDVMKSNSISPVIQRRLITFGTLPDVNAFLGLLGAQSGLTLNMNVANNQAQIAAVLAGAPPSATLRARLTAIINHATQHAEVIVARGQPQVFVGAFPQPGDLTVTRTQQIDIDDVLAIEAGAPGNGVAFAMHEIEENFRAHGVVPAAGVDRFPAAHRQAETLAEDPVARELIGPGSRVAFVQVPGTIVPSTTFFGVPIPGFINPLANTTAVFFDYENYYLGVSRRHVAATQDVQISNAQRFPKTVVSARTIDNFASGVNAVPVNPAAVAAIAAVAADVAANPTATVLIQGFTDNTGSAANNVTRSQRRANSTETLLRAAGVGALRIHATGLGAVSFVAPNVTAADRGRNRRVVITVNRPSL